MPIGLSKPIADRVSLYVRVLGLSYTGHAGRNKRRTCNQTKAHFCGLGHRFHPPALLQNGRCMVRNAGRQLHSRDACAARDETRRVYLRDSRQSRQPNVRRGLNRREDLRARPRSVSRVNKPERAALTLPSTPVCERPTAKRALAKMR